MVAPWVMLSAPRQLLHSGVLAVETMTASVMIVLLAVEAFAFLGELDQQRRGLPHLSLVALLELIDRGEHLGQADGVGVEHRAAAVGGEAVAGQVDHVDVRGAQRDAFLEDVGALVHQRVDQALDDLLVGNLAGFDLDLVSILRDYFVHFWIWNRLPVARLVAVPALARLLPVAPLLADAVADPRIDEVGTLGVTALPDFPADVEARHVAHGERSHRQAPVLRRAIDLLRARALVEQEQALLAVFLDHAVADEAVAHPGDHRHLLQLLAELHGGGEHVLSGLRAAHHLEQPHDVRRREEVRADHFLRALGDRGDRVHVERRRVAGEDRALLHGGVELPEDVLLDVHPLEHRFDHDIGVLRRGEVERRGDERHPLVHVLLPEAPFGHGVGVVLPDRRETAVERLLLHLDQGHRDAGVYEAHGDAAAHGAGADDRRFPDVARRRVFRHVGDLGGLAFGEEHVAQRLRFGGVDQILEALALLLAAFVEGLRHGGLDAGDDLERRGIAPGGLRHFGACRLEKRLGVALDLGREVANAARSLARGDQLFRVGHGRVEEIAFDDLVDHAERLRLLGRYRVAGGHHLDRFGGADHARQALRAARAGQDAELYFRQADLRLGQRDAVVAAECELEPAAEGEAADRRDQGLFHRVLLLVDHRQVGRRHLLVELADVGAARERLFAADDDHRLHRGVGLGLPQAFHDAGAQRVAQAVYRGVVEGDDGDAVAYRMGRSVDHARVFGLDERSAARGGGRFSRQLISRATPCASQRSSGCPAASPRTRCVRGPSRTGARRCRARSRASARPAGSTRRAA